MTYHHLTRDEMAAAPAYMGYDLILARPRPSSAARPARRQATPQRDQLAGKPPRSGFAWTADEDAKLIAMWNDGATTTEIAAATGRTSSAAHNRRIDLGLKARGRGGRYAPVNEVWE